jgi:hypothetical protein
VDALTSPLDPLRAEHGAGHDFTPVAGVLKTSAIGRLRQYAVQTQRTDVG